MNRLEAIDRLKQFIHEELRAKKSSENFYLIDGGRICPKCATSKRRTLYMIISNDSPVKLKCFRAGCMADFTSDNQDVNKARNVTRDELFNLGFKNEDAIKALLDCSNLIHRKTKSGIGDGNIMIKDRLPTQPQIDYIKRRCSMTIKSPEIQKYHIITNLNEVIDDNDIRVSASMEPLVKSFNKTNSITFLCNDLTLSTRAIDATPRIQKSIVNIKDSQSIGYRIGSKQKKCHTLVLAEGIFDIINAERQMINYPDNNKGVIFGATLGFAKTLKIIEYYFYQHIETIERLILFMDSDLSSVINGDKLYKYDEEALYRLLKSMDDTLGEDNFKEIFVVYSKTSKDIGDMSDKITPIKIEINKRELYAKFKKGWKR